LSRGKTSPRDFLIHEDRACLVFNKPAGLASQGGGGLVENLESLVAAAFARPGKRPPRLVHRLDRETSGILVMARTQPAAAFFSAVFAERRAAKTYVAVVCGGQLEPEQGDISAALVKTRQAGQDIMRRAHDGEAGALVALTRYRTLCATREAAVLALAPVTGRMHQLRVHLAGLGRPIAGDQRYGGLMRLSGMAVGRVMLHAAQLETPHPDGGTCRFVCPPPADWMALTAHLGLDPDLTFD
jgi:RluA family pseudouridine synthase